MVEISNRGRSREVLVAFVIRRPSGAKLMRLFECQWLLAGFSYLCMWFLWFMGYLGMLF